MEVEAGSEIRNSLLEAKMALCFLFLWTMSAEAATPALFVFGDSQVDPGNNNYLATTVKANFPPYGQQFDTRQPTGRFSDGRTMVDYLASMLGLPLVPAILNPNTNVSTVLQGVNFASGGSGILDYSGRLYGQVLSMGQQIVQFQRVKKRLLKSIGVTDTNALLSSALFCVFTGNNDWTVTYYQPGSLLPTVYTPIQFQQLLISKMISHIQNLYRLGARKIMITGAGPLGCLPSQLSMYSRDGSCVQFLDTAVKGYNIALNSTLMDLNNQLPGVRIIFADVYRATMDAITYPSAFGIKYVNTACCGLRVGQYGALPSCYPGAVCKNASEYLFWDAFHLTTKVDETMIQTLYYNGPPFCFPFGIQDLVSQS